MALQKAEGKSKSENSPAVIASYVPEDQKLYEVNNIMQDRTININPSGNADKNYSSSARKRHGGEVAIEETISTADVEMTSGESLEKKQQSWRRIFLLIVAITVHNIPGTFLLI